MHFKDDTWYVFHLEAGVSLVTRDVGFDDVTQTFTVINSYGHDAIIPMKSVSVIFEETQEAIDEMNKRREEMEKEARKSRIAGMHLN
jgi:hypothetical protein